MSSSALIDKKLEVLYDRYKDFDFAKTAQKEVEDIRRNALITGAIISGAIFVGNEAIRLTMRSPLFKLKIHNTAFWLVVPTLAAKYYYDHHIHQRIDDMWKIHQNRVDKGLGGTYNKTGIYNDKRQDYSWNITQGLQVSLEEIISGYRMDPYIDNPFQRFHQGIEDYPDFLDDIDDISMTEYDNYERLKQFQPKKGTTVGSTSIIPYEDNDQKYYHSDLQGETIWTNPPDSNVPTVDHGLDEDFIWNFNSTAYNQSVIKNDYARNLMDAQKDWHVPFWGQKLLAPSFYKEEKYQKFVRQWGIRLELEQIKMRQAIQDHHTPEAKLRMKEEIEAFLNYAYTKEQEELLKDVYVTDHSAKDKKYFTTSKAEDEHFYKYKKSVAEYNAQIERPKVTKQSRYERGTLLQKIFDPLAGAERLNNGALFVRIEEKDLDNKVKSEELLRREYEKIVENQDETMEGEEDSEDLRMAILDTMEQQQDISPDEFEAYLDKEFSIFKEGEKYDFVKDITGAFKDSLAKSQAERILDTIPEHVFWDIKKPVRDDPAKLIHPYNPFRQYPNASFFEMRDYEEYMHNRRVKKENLRDATTTYRRY